MVVDSAFLIENLTLQGVSVFCKQRLKRLQNNFLTRPLIIGIAGGSGSGKSEIALWIQHCLSDFCKVSILRQDNYYRDFENDFSHIVAAEFYHQVNLDDPQHINFNQLNQDLVQIKSGSINARYQLQKLVYGTPEAKPTILDSGCLFDVAPINIVEGIFTFYNDDVLNQCDLTIYVDVEEAVRKHRWYSRNIKENRGTTDHMWTTAKNSLIQHIAPRRDAADIVLNNGVSKKEMMLFIQQAANQLKNTDVPV